MPGEPSTGVSGCCSGSAKGCAATAYASSIPLITTLALDVCVRNGRPGEGLAILDGYLAETDTSQHRLYLGEQLRLRAELMRIADPVADVGELLDRSESLVRELDAASYLLRLQMTRHTLGVRGASGDPTTAMQETLRRLSGSERTPDVILARAMIDGSRQR